MKLGHRYCSSELEPVEEGDSDNCRDLDCLACEAKNDISNC